MTGVTSILICTASEVTSTFVAAPSLCSGTTWVRLRGTFSPIRAAIRRMAASILAREVARSSTGLIESPAANPLTAPVDRLSLATAREAYAAGEATGFGPAKAARKNDPERVLERDPINVPDPIELSDRQRWFLARVAEGSRCGAKEIVAVWQVSLKTARRDIGALQKAQLLEYVGSHRKGRYRRTPR